MAIFQAFLLLLPLNCNFSLPLTAWPSLASFLFFLHYVAAFVTKNEGSDLQRDDRENEGEERRGARGRPTWRVDVGEIRTSIEKRPLCAWMGL